MARTYTFQNSATLTKISQNYIDNQTLSDPIFTDVFPMAMHNTWKLRWWIKDNEVGLMKLRGIGGEPTRVQRVNSNVFESEPGAYGEFETFGEQELTTTSMPMDINTPVSIDGLITDAQLRLTVRQIRRMRVIAWNLALNHTFSVPLPSGGIGHSETFSGNSVTVSPLWSSTTTATPLLNLRTLQEVYGRGTSNDFSWGAKIYGNSKTLNYALANSNAADFGGKRIEGGSTLNSLPDLNNMYRMQNAPQLIAYDDGYYDDSSTFQLFLPDGKLLVVAQRPSGEKPGEFMMTRNENNPNDEPGQYAIVMDYRSGPAKQIPPHIDVHQGFNGGPVIWRPGQLLTMTVA